MLSPSSRHRSHRPVKWNRPVTTRTTENTPWIEEDHGARSEVTSTRNDESLIDRFLDVLDKSPRLGYERPTFERVFPPGFLEQLLEGPLKASTATPVWLNDVDHDNQPRDYNGRMSIARFHESTALKRIRQTGMVDGIRRRIHLQDPSSEGMGIIVLRASTEQKPVVRDFLYRHLIGETSMGLSTTKAGAFILELHLPCFVWLESGKPRPDTRPMTDQEHLRNFFDLSFLSATRARKTPPPEIDFLYESQMSLVVTGWDISGWTALSCVDSYFDDEDDAENPYMLANYDKPESDDQFAEEDDPICIGELPANKSSIKDPREYFLRAAAFRIQRFEQEWTHVGFKMEKRANQYLSDPHIPFRRRTTNLGTADNDSENVEDSEAWVKQTSHRLTELTISLSKSLKAIKQFVDVESEQIDVQTEDETSFRIRESLWDMHVSVKKMDKVFGDLSDLLTKTEKFEARLGLHIAVDNGRTIKLQHLNVTILQVFSPMALACGIIQAGLVVGNVYVWCLCLTVVLSAITMNLQRATKWYNNNICADHNTTKLLKDEELPRSEPDNDGASTGFSLSSASADLRKRLRRKLTWRKEEANPEDQDV